MSAFVVSTAHIATCAAILRETVFEYENNPPSDTDIRMDLAMSNVISVTWRYGPAGQQAYAPILASIVGKLDESGYNTNGAELPEAASGVNEACFDDGYTVTDYFEDCRKAKAIHYSLAEAFMYLSCFTYQSCEPPGWERQQGAGLDAASPMLTRVSPGAQRAGRSPCMGSARA